MSLDLPLELERLLLRVEGPAQYVGGEPNSWIKPDATFRVALAFADVYAIGMSYLGLSILYDLANHLEGIAAERVFVPFPDMEKALRQAGEPLRTLETFTPLSDCDLVAISMGSELAATNLLTLLDLGKIPLLAQERGPGMPFVFAGGHATWNPEPFADFVDAFFIGEAEEAWPKILTFLKEEGGRKAPHRQAVFERLAREIEGIYVPSLYQTQSDAQGFIYVEKPLGDVPFPVRRAVVSDFANSPIPLAPVVPIVETVHERISLEIMRGCPHGCRFCQAGMTCRPVRTRPVETLLQAAHTCYLHTGYDEIGLLSLSTSDYPDFDRLVAGLDRIFAPLGVSLSLPSLRVDAHLLTIPSRFKTVRKSGLTFAPEAGTERLRAVINKDVRDEDLLAAAQEAYQQGWKTIKLYFMIGLPTETEEDVRAIANLANCVALLRKERAKQPALHLAIGNFVPKAHTPFQWEAMDPPARLREKQRLLQRNVDSRRIHLKDHDVDASHLEGVLSRGDRRLGKVILRAWKKGARLDAWSDHFRPDLWREAFAEEGLDPYVYACAERPLGTILPWHHISVGITEDFLRREREKGYAQTPTPPCSPHSCAGCGIASCPFQPLRSS